MPSFAKIVSFAALAFGAFVSAVPLGAPAVPDVLSTVNGVVPAVPALVHRHELKSVAVVLTEAKVALTPLCAELQFIVAGNATVDAVGPILVDVKAVLSDTVSALNLLVGQPVEVILLTVDGTAKVVLADVANLLAGLLCLLFTALAHVVAVVKGDVTGILTIIAPIGELVSGLLSIVITLVGSILGDVLGALLPLIGAIVPIVLNLNLATVISILHL